MDTFRTANPDTQDRSRGLTTAQKALTTTVACVSDLLLASSPLAERCIETGIDYEIRSMEKNL